VPKKSTKNTKFSITKSHQRKITIHKKRMPIVKCICGSEILVIPDLKAMKLAIDKHVATKHKTTPHELERLSEFLAEQVIIEATKINTSTIE
jgi:hypothetical protein